jgi:diacylglycerol kinase (ATP)
LGQWKNTSLLRKFLFSCNGLKVAFTMERAVCYEVCSSATVLLLGIAMKRPLDRTIPAFLISLLPLSLELVNSAVEILIDCHIGQTYREDIRRTKDMLSASVFVSLVSCYGVALWLLIRQP